MRLNMDSDFQFWFNVGMGLGVPSIILFAKNAVRVETLKIHLHQ